ncbi:hypothetical protein [Plantactinospora sp. B5E13]|uniref:hypothetical protein n=1 Tax=unclassified Plantactinospora TaxID=2631981 RepID=UPI00325EAFAE
MSRSAASGSSATTAAIGTGLPVFGHSGDYQRLDLVNAQAFDCGIIALHYAPKRS